MKPSEISLFTAKEQTLLVSTESKRLQELDEDALAGLLGRVRRSRNKYRDLERRQSGEAIGAAGRRSASSSAAERTLRKAEIFEDAVSRVARHLSRAARANADELKRARLEGARREAAGPPTTPRAQGEQTAAATVGEQQRDIIEPARRGATSAANKRSQARKDGNGRGER